MAEDAAGARVRMVVGAADMISRRGLNATSVRELAKHTQAPLGSTYHYFPGGKYDLATEAVKWTADFVTQFLSRELQDGPLAALHAFLDRWRRIMVESSFQAGCPALAVSVEDLPEGQAAPREAAAAGFEKWTAMLAESLRDYGADASEAEGVAALIVAAVEGAVVMCRAQRAIEPLDRVAEQLIRVVTETID